MIHISALGIDEAIDSEYAKSKLEGEKEIIKNFDKAIILRPSIVYSVDDNFSTNLMTLLNRLPIFPVYYNGQTKFRPIHCSDLTEIILKIINERMCCEKIECVGPDEMSFKEILLKLMKLIDKKKLIVPCQFLLENYQQYFLNFFLNH